MLEFIINILSTPAMLVGILALVGLMLQKKPIEDVIKGTVKTIVGFLVLSAGASFLLSGSLNAFGDLFNYAFSLQGVVPNSEAITAVALNDFATDTAYIMCFGMIANILLAKFSRMKYIFLSGHLTLYLSCMLAVILKVGSLEGVSLWISGGLILGLYMVVAPSICQPTMRKITGTDDLALGHTGSIGYWISAQCAKLFKGKGKSTEEFNFPQRLSFLRDTTVAVGLTMVILFVIVTVVSVSKGILQEDPTEVLKLYPNVSSLLNVGTDVNTNWAVWALTSGLNFAGGVYIILSGVRLLVGEIVPAFRGIAEKLVPGARPAVDCPIVFPYAPNAVLIGFLTSFIGGILGLFILGWINSEMFAVALILPGVIPHFFDGATAGVFANAEGGLRGCLFGSFVNGLLITFLPALLLPVMGILQFSNSTFADSDYAVLGAPLGYVIQYLQGNGLAVLCVVLFAIPIIYNLVAPKRAVNP